MPNSDMIERNNQARDKVIAETVPALLQKFPGKLEAIAPTNDQIPQVWATPSALLEIARWLKGCGFNMLVDIGGVDYHPHREPRFEVVYHFRQLPGLGMMRVRVRCTEKDHVPSLAGDWAMANAAEREVWDQFGVKFSGHPNLTRILNPDDWEGHPLRRDYPMRGLRGLINLEMPADENRYAAFVDEEKTTERE